MILARPLAAVLAALLVFAPAAAHAAPGDVTGATLQWGFKASFRSYIAGPIAHGSWTLTGGITDATPFTWSAGTGSATAVGYPGSIRFQGHEAMGVPAGSYALDLTLSDVRVVKASDAAATIVADIRSNSLSDPTTFVTSPDVNFAAVNLAGGTNASTATTVSFMGAPATLTEAGAEAFSGFYSAGAELDPVSFSWPVEQAPEPAAPTITVSKSTNVSLAGEVVTVRGTGFGPVEGAPRGTRPPLADKFAGAYVAFGKYADVWKPSDNALPASRVNGDTKWVVSAEDAAAVGGVALKPDGSFSVDILVKRGFAGEPTTGNYGIYTYAGSGAKHAPFETYTPITFSTEPTPTSLKVSASPSAPVEGKTVTFSATVTPPAPGQLTVRAGASVLGAVTVGADGRANYTVSALSKGDKKYDFAFTPSDTSVYAGSTASKSVTVSPKKVGAGSLAWGVKQSFRDYVTGPIAKGTISTRGAGASGGVFTFGQATGGTYDAVTGLGTSKYSGSVRFTGHGGILDLSLANPIVRVESASRASLLVSIDGGASVPFATLDLAAASTSDAAGAVRYSNAPAALTAQGASAFSYNGSSFYDVGTALDPVTFTIGAASSGGASTTVAAFVDTSNTPAATAPTATGATAELLEGGEVSITAGGFEAGEEGILVVVYSDPVVLADDVTADAAGEVSWTGRLPATLTGTHTLTLQGSVDRGAVIEIPTTVVATAATTCPVDDAAITWGFKESFRSYISGSIAHGKWEVSGGATYEVPNFGFAPGAGSYEAATSTGELTFAGAIRFTGHDGVLDTTVSNPVVRFIDADTAILALDVAGVTQDGAEIDQAGVEFVELDLAAATVANESGAITIAGAPAKLLPAGAAAFGTYESGEEFDPVTLAFTTDPACAVPATGEETVVATADEPAPDLSWLPWAIIGLLIVIIAALVVVVVRRRA